MKAKAYVLAAFKQPLVAQEFELPRLQDGEVLVRMLASGVCGSDLHMAAGADPRTPLPIVLGHEGLGEVVEIGGRKTDLQGRPLKVGDRILWNRGVVCGQCFWCTHDQPWLCPERFVYGIHRSTQVGCGVNGCYAEYLPLDARTDIISMRGVPADELLYYVSAGCSGATAAHAFEALPPRPGETVVVQGGGPLGMCLLALARESGAARLVAIDPWPERLALAREFGATETLCTKETMAESRVAFVKELTAGRGADAVYEAAGRAAAIVEGLALVRPGGRVVTAGFGQPGGTLAFDPFAHLTRPNLTLAGIWVSHTRHTLAAVELVRRHLEAFKKLTTHVFPLSRVNEAHDKMRQREALKAVLIAE